MTTTCLNVFCQVRWPGVLSEVLGYRRQAARFLGCRHISLARADKLVATACISILEGETTFTLIVGVFRDGRMLQFQGHGKLKLVWVHAPAMKWKHLTVGLCDWCRYLASRGEMARGTARPPSCCKRKSSITEVDSNHEPNVPKRIPNATNQS